MMMFTACCCVQEGMGEEQIFTESSDNMLLRNALPASWADKQGEAQPAFTTRYISFNKKGKAIGMKLDTADGVAAQITGIKEGAVMDFNSEAQLSDQVQEGDFIVAVNGERGNIKEMIQRIKKEDQLVFEVVRVEPFIVTLEKPPISPTDPGSPTSSAPASPRQPGGQAKTTDFDAAVGALASEGTLSPGKQSLRRAGTMRGGTGLVLSHAPDSVSILITEVGDGPIQDWNRVHTALAVRKFDRIVSVNGVGGKQMMKSLNRASTVELAVLRCPR